MGAYINPSNQTKEEWLEKNAAPLDNPPNSIPEDQEILPVCLVDNGPFTAAGICFCDQELEAFRRPDGRSKVWFLAETEDLHEVSSELERYMNYSS